jgi:site-specific DNA-methyltransferase (adenine-specific)
MNPETIKTFRVYNEDCLEAMSRLGPNSIDTIITDPPYGLKFMGKGWDHGIPGVPFWEAALRVAKPGAMLMAFGGDRTHHRLMCAIEDAGWGIRTTIGWIYGTGFPKSHNIGKSTQEKEWQGWGTALKPSIEIIVVAMKKLDGTFAQNALKWGVAGLWIDGCRVETEENTGRPQGTMPQPMDWGNKSNTDGTVYTSEGHSSGRWPANLIYSGEEQVLEEFARQSEAMEMHGAGKKRGGQGKKTGQNKSMFCGDHEGNAARFGDEGSAARFFYCAKASKRERNEGLDTSNGHPTVKPIALLGYLCKLTATPTGGIVFDPFMGSGSTGVACAKVGRRFLGCENDKEHGYFKIALKRIQNAYAKTTKKLPSGP